MFLLSALSNKWKLLSSQVGIESYFVKKRKGDDSTQKEADGEQGQYSLCVNTAKLVENITAANFLVCFVWYNRRSDKRPVLWHFAPSFTVRYVK